jgi:hypothetical protein
MIILQVLAQGHHGYPQPENDYYKSIYLAFCARCGIHGRQSAPFRLRRSQRASHSSFVQLNWVFDAWFVHPEVATELTSSGISGISFGPSLDHGTGDELSDRRQLLTSTVISCAETSRLPAVTCRPDNEESEWKIVAGRTRYNALTPYCGNVKHHVPSSLAIKSGVLGDVPDLFQTAEWFGSGGAAHRLTLCTERFAELVTSRRWRGLEFRSVQDGGWSAARPGPEGCRPY